MDPCDLTSVLHGVSRLWRDIFVVCITVLTMCSRVVCSCDWAGVRRVTWPPRASP